MSVRPLSRILGLAAAALGLTAPAATPRPLPAQVAVEVPATPGGWIGFQYRLVTEDRPSGPPGTTIVVESVVDGSPADRAGLRAGDRILRINGRAVSARVMAELGARLGPGDPVALTLTGEGWRKDVTLHAAPRPPRTSPPLPPELAQRLDSALQRLDSVRVVIARAGDVAARTVTVETLAPVVHVDGRRVVRIEGSSLPEPPVLVGTPEVTGSARVDAEGTAFRIWVETFGDSARWTAGDAEVRARVRPLREARAAPPPSPAPEPPRAETSALAPYVVGANRVAGAEVTPLNPALGEYFGVDRGLLVTEVTPETPAREAGLRAGDVLTAVDGRPVASLQELRRALASGGPGETDLEVVRRGRTLTLRLAR